MEKSSQELKTNIEESNKRMEKSSQELKKLVADVTKNLGGLGNTLGKLTEALLSSELWKKFAELGYEFSRQSQRYQFVENRRVMAEADFWLENGEYVMAVEVKTELTTEDVKTHLERMDIIRRYMDGHGDTRKMIGAVAGGIVAANIASFAHRNGFYVVVQSGDAIAVADRPDGFKAREW
jgi:predicted AAA+ superfamily ATPase